MSELKQNKNGLYYFDDLPDKYRLATLNDFTEPEERIPFLVLGFSWPVYQCYRLTDSSDLDQIRKWIEMKRVFVLK